MFSQAMCTLSNVLSASFTKNNFAIFHRMPAAFSESARTAGIPPNDQFAVSMPRYV
jgi:hypothetical protein